MQLVVTKQKKLMMSMGLIVILLVLTSCGNNKFIGKWEAYTDQGYRLDITITKKAIQIHSGDNLNELPYTHGKTDDNMPMIEAEKDGVLMMASISEKTDTVKDEILYLLISNDGGYTSQQIVGKKVNKSDISFLQVCILALIGIGVITHIQQKKGKDKTHG
ncbi:hypothetical protein [Candidatus Enterococcus clewellii]|uniref:Lipoprotein n=1 Tax=Candidatus Enterococcus clewellii TaxID=1834193 RepID=A0AAQ3VSK7_9ENTE